ncbi:heat shock protein 30C-like [Rhineura floridana]|uniref:heat shock protein 30C-like n=1 Tax=Rhineura floridana TaxID=261503 RepID=UPI002AC85721|nr:heat shock protein 30C-like [Rhineura floridana]
MLCRLHLAAPRSPLQSRALWPRTQSLFEELEQEMDSMWELLSGNWHPMGHSTASREMAHRPEVASPGGTFAVTQDMAGFDPRELVVKLEGEKVVLTGKKATQTPGGPFRYELFRREWDVPGSVDRERLSCSISGEGQLRIEAPPSEPAARTVPIEVNLPGPAAEAPQEPTSTENSRTKG